MWRMAVGQRGESAAAIAAPDTGGNGDLKSLILGPFLR
jgi:hypothetical protein